MASFQTLHASMLTWCTWYLDLKVVTYARVRGFEAQYRLHNVGEMILNCFLNWDSVQNSLTDHLKSLIVKIEAVDFNNPESINQLIRN